MCDTLRLRCQVVEERERKREETDVRYHLVATQRTNLRLSCLLGTFALPAFGMRTTQAPERTSYRLQKEESSHITEYVYYIMVLTCSAFEVVLAQRILLCFRQLNYVKHS